jgi:hypothetical protein
MAAGYDALARGSGEAAGESLETNNQCRGNTAGVTWDILARVLGSVVIALFALSIEHQARHRVQR